MKRYFAVIVNSRSTSNNSEHECTQPLYVFESKEDRNNFVKDLKNYYPVNTPVVKQYFEFCK